jgi:hypothetical protein
LLKEIWFFSGVPRRKLYIICISWSSSYPRMKSAVGKLLLDSFLNTTVWQCACHRPELGMSDAEDEVTFTYITGLI